MSIWPQFQKTVGGCVDRGGSCCGSGSNQALDQCQCHAGVVGSLTWLQVQGAAEHLRVMGQLVTLLEFQRGSDSLCDGAHP